MKSSTDKTVWKSNVYANIKNSITNSLQHFYSIINGYLALVRSKRWKGRGGGRGDDRAIVRMTVGEEVKEGKTATGWGGWPTRKGTGCWWLKAGLCLMQRKGEWEWWGAINRWVPQWPWWECQRGGRAAGHKTGQAGPLAATQAALSPVQCWGNPQLWSQGCTHGRHLWKTHTDTSW